MHLYLHVPFCARRCSYCDFAIAVRRAVPSAGYRDAILREWGLRLSHPAWSLGTRVETVYFGGGTPSRLEPGVLGDLLARIAADRPLAADAEVTIEANPEDVTAAASAAWRAAGINRVSLGVQSFDPSVLRWMHRTHTAEQVPRAVDLLRGAGFASLSLDLIFGLPAGLERDWPRDLAAAAALSPEHLSLYGLTVEAGTPLGRWTARGETIPVDDERYAAEFLQAHRALAQAGFVHYEVSNYARPGHRARHNTAYWRRAPYLGLGPSAHGGWGRERQWNLREWVAYERAAAAGADPTAGRETLDDVAVALEELYLGLRTDEGVPVSSLGPGTAAAWVGQGWAEVEADRLRLTAEGWLRLDALAVAAGPKPAGAARFPAMS
jgi:oxygen-independent coproporphyrinogen-3 oxidase